MTTSPSKYAGSQMALVCVLCLTGCGLASGISESQSSLQSQPTPTSSSTSITPPPTTLHLVSTWPQDLETNVGFIAPIRLTFNQALLPANSHSTLSSLSNGIEVYKTVGGIESRVKGSLDIQGEVATFRPIVATNCLEKFVTPEASYKIKVRANFSDDYLFPTDKEFTFSTRNFDYVVESQDMAVDGNGNVLAAWVVRRVATPNLDFGTPLGRSVIASRWSQGTGWSIPVNLFELPYPMPFGIIGGLQISADRAGNGIVIFYDDDSATLGTTIKRQLHSVRYSKDSGWGQDEMLSIASFDNTEPVLALSASGIGIVAWTRVGLNATSSEIETRIFQNGWGSSQLLASGTGNAHPSLAIDPDGKALIAWSLNSGSGFDVYGAYHAATTTNWTLNQRLNSGAHLTSDTFPKVRIVQSLGKGIVAWTSTGASPYPLTLGFRKFGTNSNWFTATSLIVTGMNVGMATPEFDFNMDENEDLLFLWNYDADLTNGTPPIERATAFGFYPLSGTSHPTEAFLPFGAHNDLNFKSLVIDASQNWLAGYADIFNGGVSSYGVRFDKTQLSWQTPLTINPPSEPIQELSKLQLGLDGNLFAAYIGSSECGMPQGKFTSASSATSQWNTPTTPMWSASEYKVNAP